MTKMKIEHLRAFLTEDLWGEEYIRTLFATKPHSKSHPVRVYPEKTARLMERAVMLLTLNCVVDHNWPVKAFNWIKAWNKHIAEQEKELKQ